jgi:ribosomal protein L40E
MPATVTVSFTLTAPSSDTTWSLKATAVIMDVNSSGNLQPVGTYSVKQFDVLVTGSQLQSTTQSRTTATPTNTIVTTSIASIPTQTSTSSTIPHYAFGWLLPVLLLAVAAIVTFTFVYYVLPMIRSRTTKPRVTEPRPVKSVAQRTEKATEDLFCFKCGARLKPHAEFCSKCGSAQA